MYLLIYIFPWLYSIIRTGIGIKIEKDIDKLKYAFQEYLRILFDEWKRNIPAVIQQTIIYPLFTISDDKKIGLNFPNEVI